MPCSSSDGMGQSCNHNDLYQEALKARREADELARMLCDLCTELAGSPEGIWVITRNRRVRDWWAAHQAQDARTNR